MDPTTAKCGNLIINTPSLASEDTLENAAHAILNSGMRALPVIENNLVVGIVSESDIISSIERISRNLLDMEIGKISTECECVTKKDKVGKVRNIMIYKNVSRVPVIEGNKILVFGDGKQIRDFNYVDDVVNAILLSAQSEDADGMIFNLGADDPINLEDTAKLMIEISHNANYELVPFPAERKAIDIGDYYADYRKIRSKLGWQPKISLKDGLKLTINYYQEFNKHYCE